MVAGAAGRILTTELTSSCRRFSGAIPDRWRFPFSHEYSRSISSRERSLSVCRSDKRRRRRRGTVVAQALGGEFVGDVVAQLVLGGVVPFLFLDQLEAAAFARVGRIEGTRIKFDAFT